MKYLRSFFLQYGGLMQFTIKGLFLVLVFLLLPIFTYADTSNFTKQINYQGKLTDSTGITVADGSYNMRFKLYNALSGGSAIWTNTLIQDDRVVVTNGLFSVLLGATSTALTSIDFNQPLYLSVDIGGTTNTATPTWDGEMSPRKTLGTVPHSFNSDELDGLDSTAFVRTDATSTIATSSAQTLLTLNQLGAGDILSLQANNAAFLTVTNSGYVGIGTTSPALLFSVVGGIFASSTATSTFQGGGINLITAGGNTGCFAVDGTCISGGGGSGTVSLGTRGYLAFYNADGTTISGTSTLFMARSGNFGIGTTNPQYSLDIATTTRTSNLIAQNITLSRSYDSILSAFIGSVTGYTNFSGGIGSGANLRLTNTGNLVNIGSIQAGETLLTSGGTFATQIVYGVGTLPYGVVADDLNGDGWADLAVVNSGSTGVNGLSVLINDGDGTFATAVDYTTGNAPRSATVADFDGDGHKDIAVGNSLSDTVSVFINNGSGTFASQITYTVGSQVYDVTAGDLNGDGKADLAVVNSGDNNVSILFNNGNGTFATAINYITGTGPFTVAIDDLNGDGRADLAVANSMDGSVSILLNLGDGTFATKVDYPAGTNTKFVVIGDLDGDNMSDMAATNSASDTVSVYINNGDGTFDIQVTYGTGSEPFGLSLNDLNGDGRADLAVANSGSTGVDGLSVLMNNGDGTLATAVNYMTDISPFALDVGDFNGDGKADLAVVDFSTNNISVFFNQPTVMLYAQASTGKIAIGTSTPISTLSIQGSLCVRNTGSCGTAAGNIYASNATVNGIDLAERYQRFDDTLEPGDIVSLTKEDISSSEVALTESFGIRRADSARSERVIGILSTDPGLTLGKDIGNASPVALSGRVPVKVNLENGPIAVGDYITLSSVPGVGKRATEAGDTIGIALESFDSSEQGTISIFVNLGYQQISPAISNGTMDIDMSAKDILNVRKIISDSGRWSLDETGKLTVDTLEIHGNVRIGSSERRSGITLYDEVTGEPYCIKVSRGIIASTLGECIAVGSGNSPSGEGLSTIDTESPVIYLNGNATSTLDIGDSFVDPSATVTDNIDHNLGVQVTTWTSGHQVNAVDTNVVGEYTLKYNATDSAGNKALELLRIVTVVDPFTMSTDLDVATTTKQAFTTPY